LTDTRQFRAPFSEAEAKRYLTDWTGIEFDPKIVQAFLSLENLEELKSYFTS
jgi:response regulator RpfG family c-di-GMP phosphodiesterase